MVKLALQFLHCFVSLVIYKYRDRPRPETPLYFYLLQNEMR